MAEKTFACFDISSSTIKLLIGYELSGAPVVLYTKELAIPGLIKDGMIVDPQGLEKAFASFRHFSDESIKLRGDIAEICMVLPPLGLKIYEKSETTRGVSASKDIGRIDIANVIQQVNNELIPGGNVIVDIIPDQFLLDNGEVYQEPPLGKKSATLTVKAKIHTLPQAVISDYQTLANNVGYRIKKTCVAPYCCATLFATYPDLPRSYVLVDMGARVTSITLVGEGEPYKSGYFLKGGDDLSEEIAESFGIDPIDGEKLKKRYGYEERILSFDPPLLEGIDSHLGTPTPYYQKDLNAVIENYFEGYMAQLTNAIATILNPYHGQFDTLPILLTGGASKLHGLERFFASAMPARPLIKVTPRSIGARDPRYSALLGIVLASSKYTGSLEDHYRGVAPVSRVSKKEKRARPSPSDDIL